MKSDLPERTYLFAKEVVGICSHLHAHGGLSRTIANQLLRSGTSVGANVEEGQAAQSRADFRHKHVIACKEARETRYWLRLIADTGLRSGDDVANARRECTELIAILTSIVKRTDPTIRKDAQGPKEAPPKSV